MDRILTPRAQTLQNPLFQTPPELASRMRTLEVMHYDFQGKIQCGHIIIHELVLEDVRLFFETAFKLRFPIHSLIPIDRYGWNDIASCGDNNSSGYNMRFLEDGRMSKHGIGCAFDINPVQNPCFVLDEKDPLLALKQQIPQNGLYVPGAPGTLTNGHPLVKLMLGRGWAWGGKWDYPADFQHFQIVPPELAHYVN